MSDRSKKVSSATYQPGKRWLRYLGILSGILFCFCTLYVYSELTDTYYKRRNMTKTWPTVLEAIYSSTGLHRNPQQSVTHSPHCLEQEMETEQEEEKEPEIKLSLSDVHTPQFLPDYKNPCWMNESRTLRCVPYVYLAGFPKCGTTDLYNRLIAHPLIVQSGVTKEPHYLTRSLYSSGCPLHSVNDSVECHLDEYSAKYFYEAAQDIQSNVKEKTARHVFVEGYNVVKELFPHEYEQVLQTAKEKHEHPMIAIDGSASTAWDNSHWRSIEENKGRSAEEAFITPDLINRINPDSKFIIILREPGDRFYSDYKYFKSNNTREEFHERVVKVSQIFTNCSCRHTPLHCLYELGVQHDVRNRILIGMYHTHISQMLERIPRERFLFLRSEDFRNNVTPMLEKCFEFLDLPPLSPNAMDTISQLETKNLNKNTIGPMWPETKKILQEFYAEEKEKLARLLGDDRFRWKDMEVNKTEAS